MRTTWTQKSSRKGLSLVEIMMAVLVLSVGLLGVLAAIPFGGFQMARMKDADYSSTVAKNAFSTIIANGWHNPANWDASDNNKQSYISHATNYPVIFNSLDEWVNLRYPFLLDGVREEQSVIELLPPSQDPWHFFSVFEPAKLSSESPSDYQNKSLLWTRIWPESPMDLAHNSDDDIDLFFYTHDDILYGTTEAESNGDYRPKMESGTSSYTGEYTWMAMMQPQSMESSFDRCPLNEIKQVKTDVVVFKGRAPTDGYEIYSATVPNNLYLGGTFSINYDSTLWDLLESSTHVILTGDSDVTIDSDTPRRYTEWFKIANFTKRNGKIRLTLTGAACPQCWTAGSTITLVVFPDVVGVQTRYLEIE
ncbi:MAG: prepilin-type N-terminal cleavage/methylation domain-containing protein [Planctomycetia bacterium]|nr:prepilin-type N-terminal cleavage/methylation domain-containing protein [Planctomycetia bacterium]